MLTCKKVFVFASIFIHRSYYAKNMLPPLSQSIAKYEVSNSVIYLFSEKKLQKYNYITAKEYKTEIFKSFYDDCAH